MKRLSILLLTLPMAANADLIVDTGTNETIVTNWALSDFQWLAGEFSVGDDYTINSIEGWIGASNFGDLTLALYDESGELPGTELYSATFTSTGENSWQGVFDLAWDIVVGTYYAAFEVRAGQTFSGSLPDTALAPLPGYAFTSSGSWLPADHLGSGFRIDADLTTVPEPSTLALLGIGLLGMGAARRRKKA